MVANGSEDVPAYWPFLACVRYRLFLFLLAISVKNQYILKAKGEV